jgi:hypothetical protein
VWTGFKLLRIRSRFRAVVNTVISLCVLYKAVKFLISSATISFSTELQELKEVTLFHAS